MSSRQRVVQEHGLGARLRDRAERVLSRAHHGHRRLRGEHRSELHARSRPIAPPMRPAATSPYWHLGTQGAQDPNTKQYSTINNAPDSLLQIYAIKARKGLPLGFEIAGSLGTIANTSLWVSGGDIRWSLMEGFRTGALGILPDISVGGGVRTLTGTSRFYLTTVGIDVKMSKPITLRTARRSSRPSATSASSSSATRTSSTRRPTSTRSGSAAPTDPIRHRRTALPQQAARTARTTTATSRTASRSRRCACTVNRGLVGAQLSLRAHLARQPDRLRHHRAEGREPVPRRGPPVDALIRRRRLLLSGAFALASACAAEACGAPSGALVGVSDRASGRSAREASARRRSARRRARAARRLPHAASRS